MSNRGLTNREYEVIRMVAAGASNREIAGNCGIAEHTARFHLNNVMMKTGANSRTAAVVVALKFGWLKLEDIDIGPKEIPPTPPTPPDVTSKSGGFDAARKHPRTNPDDAFEAFMAMPLSEWRGLLGSLVRGGILTPAEQQGFDRAAAERSKRKRCDCGEILPHEAPCKFTTDPEHT